MPHCPAAHSSHRPGEGQKHNRCRALCRAPVQGKWRGKQQVSGWQVNARGPGGGHHPGSRLLMRWQGLWAPHFVQAVLPPSPHSHSWWQGRGTIIPPFPLLPLSTEWAPGAETKVLLSLLFCSVQQRNLRVNEDGSFREEGQVFPQCAFYKLRISIPFSKEAKTQH